jgi:hypothetical protein
MQFANIVVSKCLARKEGFNRASLRKLQSFGLSLLNVP